MTLRIRVSTAALWLTVLLCAIDGHAQSLPFRGFSSDDGLAESVVLAMAQERSGHLWFGTADGLSRFDGLEFENFGSAEGLPHNVVRAIHQDATGTVWAGTDGGLVRWSGRVWEAPFPKLEGLSVRCFAETDDGALWVGTFGRGVAKIEAGAVTWVTIAGDLAHLRIRALLADRAGRLWIGAFGGGVSVSAGGGRDRFETVPGLGNQFVRDLVELQDGQVLAATNSGVYRWVDDAFQPLEVGDGLRSAVVTSLLEDRRSRLWIGTRDQGACHLDGEALTCFHVEDGLADNSLTDLLEDREGNLWFATFGGGVSRLSSESFRNVTALEGLPFGGVRAFAEVGGEMWIGTHGGGIARLGGSRITTLTTADGLPHPKVFTIWADGGGEAWVGTLEGAARWKGGEFESFSVADGLAHETVYEILRDRSGTLWFATLGGLTAWNQDGPHTYRVRDGLPNDRVNTLVESRSGGLWIGTGSGVVRLRDGRFEDIHGTADGLGDGFVMDLHEARDGTLWIGTAGGVSRLGEEGRIETLTRRDGLSRDKCTVILEDPSGRMWIGTTRGIDIWDGRSFRSFTDRDGLPSSEVLLGAGLRDRWDRLWFGTVRGAVVFEPDAAPPEVPPPPVSIVGVEASGEALDLAGQLHLGPGQDNLRFEFVGISLAYPGDVLYEYRLEGLDRRPRRTRARTVEYASVPPGSYTFEVRASLGGEGWSEQPATLELTLSPPFWQAWWFRFIVGLGVAVLMVATHLARVQSLQRRERRLEEEVRKRTEEVRRERLEVARTNQQLEVVNRELRQLNETKDEFLGVAAHDLRSPLGGILSYTSLLLRLLDSGSVDPARWRRFLGNVHTTADQMLRMVNDLLDVASIEAGRVEVQLERLPIAEVLAEREALHLPTAMEKGIELVVEIEDAGVEVLGDRLRTGEILDNLIGNALKFTHPGGRARVFTELLGRELVIHVADTGQGLGPEEIESVFAGRRLSARPTAGEPSTGLGLVIVRKLVELQGGRVWATSEKGRGSTFSFSLPFS